MTEPTMTSRFRNSIVSASGTLLHAMQALDTSGTEIALVVEDGNRIVGILTDGDIRRALLRGATIASPLAPHIQPNFARVSPETGRAEVLDLMRARYIGQVPIVDAAGQLVGLHLLHEVLGHIERPNWAVIMAGGKGTRLRPLTEDIPKPLLRVAGRPILERIVLHLVGFGIREIFLSINYLGHMVEDHFGDGSKFGCRIEYLREQTPLGTGGALSLLPNRAMHPLLVMNGDLVTQANIADLLDFHCTGGQAATIGVRRYAHTIPFGCLDVDGDRVVNMEEKPIVTHLINAGMYVLDPAVAARVQTKEVGMPSLMLDCIERGEPVKAFQIEDDWIDVGQKDQLHRAQQGTS